MKKRVTPEALADMLMKRVYVPFSAVVSAAADGEILSLCQFDTTLNLKDIQMCQNML